MAVEARHLFPPQLLGNRDMMNGVEWNTDMYNAAQMGMGYRGIPLSTADSSTLLPMYSCVMPDSIPQKKPAAVPIKSESGLSYHHLPNPAPRKRSRDQAMINPLLSYQNPTPINNNKNNTATASPFSFLGQDLSLHIHQQQIDIDSLISHHMDEVRMELEEKRKRQTKRIIEAIEEGMLKRLREKEEEIVKIGKLNWALEERVKSLCIENQIWRDLAQTNEATANALRTNLEQVLAAQIKDERTHDGVDKAEMDDAQSCCGSCGGKGGDEVVEAVTTTPSERRTLAGGAQDMGIRNSGSSRMCRNCGMEESCVLLLPCRHLCLCTICGSSLNTCPICKATKNASFHVNMS